MRGPGAPIFPDQDFNVPDDQLAVRTAAVAVDPGEGARRGRLIVVADETFLERQFAQANPQNVTFAANAVDWLAQDEALIRIRSKDRTPPALAFGSDFAKNFLKWGNLLGIPVLFALVGIVRVSGRRRRAEARWKEVVS